MAEDSRADQIARAFDDLRTARTELHEVSEAELAAHRAAIAGDVISIERMQ